MDRAIMKNAEVTSCLVYVAVVFQMNAEMAIGRMLEHAAAYSASLPQEFAMEITSETTTCDRGDVKDWIDQHPGSVQNVNSRRSKGSIEYAGYTHRLGGAGADLPYFRSEDVKRQARSDSNEIDSHQEIELGLWAQEGEIPCVR